MEFFRKLSIGRKILLIPAFGAIGFITYLVISISAVNSTVDQLSEAQSKQFPLLQIAQTSLVNLEKIKETLGSAVSTGESEMLDLANELRDSLKSDLAEVIAIDPQVKAEIDNITSDFDEYYASAFSLSKEMVDGTADFSTVGQRSEAMSAQLVEIEDSLDTFRTHRMDEFTAAFDNANEAATNISTVGITLGVITITALFAVAIPISSNIRKNLNDVIATLRDIAEDNGDLTIRLKTTSKDEIGDLVYWFNSFIEKLQGVIKQIVDSALPLAEMANNVNTLSGEIQTTMSDQLESSHRSKASVDEMSQSVGSIAQNAAEAANAAKDADAEAHKGHNVVSNTVTSIQQLSENMREAASTVSQLEQDTNRVNVVLEVIKGIAEQTNLLALNAAIEAARAGEQGRGFAVVADEVRSLASRTQESTEEINAMLATLQSAAKAAVGSMEASTLAVTSTVEEANKAGDSLQTITETVNTINAMNEQIAVATEEQQTVSELMVGHVDEIQSQTEGTAESSSQLAGVADDLNKLAGNLEEIARQFKV